MFLGIPNVQNNDSATALVLGSPPFPNEVIQSDTPGFQVFKTLDSHWGQMGPGMIIIHKPEPSGDVLPHPFLLLVAQPRSISRAQTLDTLYPVAEDTPTSLQIHQCLFADGAKGWLLRGKTVDVLR